MKKAILCFLAVLFCATCAYADDKSQDVKQDSNPYQDWLTYYYLEKDTAKVPDFLQWLEKSGMLDKHPAGVPAVEGFLSVVFAQNPDKAQGWGHAAAFTGKTEEAVDYALKPPVAPQDAEIKAPADIDRMWGAFSASGDDLYLKKIVGVLDAQKKLTGDAKADQATREAAAWSLGSNMTQHEAVDRFLMNEIVSATGEVDVTLKRIVAGVKKQRDAHALPNRNGEFSAMLIVTDPALAAREMAKASGDVMHFKEMAEAKRGDTRTVVIVFAGMGLTPDYRADVTYDEKLIDPAGKVYKDLKNLEGLKRKLPTRFRIFNNQAAVFIAFDKKDKPGVYKVHVLLKDNVGKKTIPMDTKITLRK